jgi:hypothetical protein
MTISLKPQRGTIIHLETERDEEPLRIDAGEYRGNPKIGLRQTFRGKQDGRLYFGKQGLNIPQGDFLTVVTAMLHAYNASNGSTYRLVGGDEAELELVDEALHIVDEAVEKGLEPVYEWGRG